MSTKTRAFRATHAPAEQFVSPLPDVRALIEAGAITHPDAVQDLARTVHLPVAPFRGAISSFDDAHAPPDAVRVCAGTSCALAGGGKLAFELSRTHKCHSVYCLGYCDRSPAALTPSGHVVPHATAATFPVHPTTPVPHPPPPFIRTVSRHAVVTGRLANPEWRADTLPRYVGLELALRQSPADVVQTLMDSGLRGRGGAAFPTGQKWKAAANASGSPKFVVANGDEGDPGSFIDRELMERDPHAILEGMAICAHAVGASHGVVFVRSEYPVAARVMTRAINECRSAGILGPHARGVNHPFDIEVVQGLGSYVCGEETAMLAAIEAHRGEVSPRPPYPVERGLFGCPTVVDNVETLANVPWILERGVGAYVEMGTEASRGTKAVCLNHGFRNPGIVELEFGAPLAHVINDLGGGGSNGSEIEAILLGGPVGSIVTPDQWDTPLCFSAMSKRGINLGHAGLVAIPRGTDWRALLTHLLTFMRDESCGKCTPCRLGTLRAREIADDPLSPKAKATLVSLMGLMKDASLCAFGRETPGPVMTTLEKFGDRLLPEVAP